MKDDKNGDSPPEEKEHTNTGGLTEQELNAQKVRKGCFTYLGIFAVMLVLAGIMTKCNS